MRTFKDNSGQIWTIDLTPKVLADVCEKSDGRFDLLDPKTVKKCDDIETLSDILWNVLFPQFFEHGVDPAKFFGTDATVLARAQVALLREWADLWKARNQLKLWVTLGRCADRYQSIIRKKQRADRVS